MSKLVLLATFLVSVNARPSQSDEYHNVHNVITAPPNCPPGQQWINSQCRDVWIRKEKNPFNVVTVPPNCPAGQEWINGQCRDIWKLSINPQNSITKVACSDGQLMVNGKCASSVNNKSELKEDFQYPTLLKKREIKILPSEKYVRSADEGEAEIQNRNIITIPNQCPTGFLPDALGICRPVFDF